MTREDALKYTITGMIVSRHQVEMIINEVFDDFEVEKEEFANQLTRDIYSCKDIDIKRDIHRTINKYLD